MRFVIITGLSGAGKSQAVRSLEDIGYYCVDNMPPALIPKFAEICFGSRNKFDRVALVCDIRGGDTFEELFSGLNELSSIGYNYEILFLETRDEILIKRYKETRRSHPLDREGRLSDAITRERELLKEVKERAAHIIDTSDKLPKQLNKEIKVLFGADEAGKKTFLVSILSFGFKYGIPLDSDLVFDVRFLPNPFYIDELKEHTGVEPCVANYVMSFPQSREFLGRLCEMMDFLIPYYIEEGKSNLVISIGCTGGRHRSVSIAEALSLHLTSGGFDSIISHRDSLK